MTLTLPFHPFVSYCQKALIALDENDIPFESVHVDLGDPASTAAFKALWPIGKFPVLVDDARGVTLPESSILVEYLDRFYPGPDRFPPDRRHARRGRRPVHPDGQDPAADLWR